MVRRLAVSLALFFVLPASAHAADVSVDAGGVLRYTGAPGKVSNVNFDRVGRRRPGTVTVDAASPATTTPPRRHRLHARHPRPWSRATA